MRLTRRDLLRSSSTGAGAFLLAPAIGRLGSILDRPLGPSSEFATSRASRLFPGTRLVHADLHNHTLMSDGDGDPADAFASMREAGLDVAALTDHATLSKFLPESVCAAIFESLNDDAHTECQSLAGIDEGSWARTAELADAENTPGEFVAIRGFEWSSPTLGHVNVWFSSDWIDPAHTGGVGAGEGAGLFLHDESDGFFPQELTTLLDEISHTHGQRPGMQGLYEWLNLPPATPGLSGGLDGIAGFNHPGREVGRFEYFSFEPRVRDRIVSLEVFNRREDYLFEGTNLGEGSPINQCLNAGWRVGLLGVTDEHGTDWGHPDGKGRAGLWVEELTRDGVKAAMQARRFFATNLRGLRLDASATSGVEAEEDTRVRMGGELVHRSGEVTFELDIDRGPDWRGKALVVQVLRPGPDMPVVLDAVPVTVPTEDEEGDDPISFTVSIDRADGDWVFLRICDPERAVDGRAQGTYAASGGAVAYTSPWFLTD